MKVVNTLETNMSNYCPTIAKFSLGKIIMTKEAAAAIKAAQQEPEEFLARHQSGDWGSLTCSETDENERGMVHQSYIRSVYKTALGARLWVLTSGDRSSTSILIAP